MQPLPSVSVTCGNVSQNGKQKADHSGSSFKPSSSSCTFLKHHLTGEEMASHCQSSGSFHCSRIVQSSFSQQFAKSRTQHLESSPWCSAGGKSSDGICKCSNDLFVHLPLVSDESVISCHATAQFAGSLQRYLVRREKCTCKSRLCICTVDGILSPCHEDVQPHCHIASMTTRDGCALPSAKASVGASPT